MEEMKRAQELRVDEISQCKILQKIMRQYKNSLRSCRKFKDRWILRVIQENFKKWSRITVDNFSHVSSQPARIPSPRAMLSCHKRLPLDTWNRSGSQENVFANPRPTLESSQTPHRGIHQFATPTAGEAPTFMSTKRLVAREEERSGNAIPMATFARRPSTTRSFSPVGIPQSSMVGQ